MQRSTMALLVLCALAALLFAPAVQGQSSTGGNAGPCSSGPCQNGATCNVVNNGFVCACPAGFDGTTCEKASSSSSTGVSGGNSSTGAGPGAGSTGSNIDCQVTPGAPQCVPGFCDLAIGRLDPFCGGPVCDNGANSTDPKCNPSYCAQNPKDAFCTFGGQAPFVCKDDGSDNSVVWEIKDGSRYAYSSECPDHSYQSSRVPSVAALPSCGFGNYSASPEISADPFYITDNKVLHEFLKVSSNFANSKQQDYDREFGVSLTGIPIWTPQVQGKDGNLTDEYAAVTKDLDACGGYTGPDGKYRYYKKPTDGCGAGIAPEVSGQHSPLWGFMQDGVPIYGPKTVGGVTPTDLDECGGHTDAEHPFYHYHSRDGFPYTVNCLKGCFKAGDAPPGATCTTPQSYDYSSLSQAGSAQSDTVATCGTTTTSDPFGFLANQPPAPPLVITAPPIPNAPTLALSPVQADLISISWNAVSANNDTSVDYILEADEGQTGTFKEIANTTVAAFSLTGAPASTAYDFRVSAHNRAGTRGPSATATITTAAAPAPAPTGVTAASPTKDTVTVSWTATPAPTTGPAITGYIVVYKKTTETDAQAQSTAIISGVSTVVRFLESSTAYEFKVRTVTAVVGPLSSPATATTLAPPPGQVTAASFSVSSLTTLDIKVDPVPAGTTVLEFVLTPKGGSALATVSATVTPGSAYTESIPSLSQNTEYTLVITSKANSADTTGTVSPTFTTFIPASVAGQATNVQTDVSTVGQVKLTWVAPAQTGGDAAILYLVTVKRSAGGGSQSLTTVNLQATFTGLLSGENYDAEITAINSAGSGAVSIKSFTSGTAAPVILSVVAADSSSSPAKGYTAGDTITVTFDKGTNQPAGAVTDVFDIQGAGSGLTLTGAWSTASVYVITATDAAGTAPQVGVTFLQVKSAAALKNAAGSSGASTATSGKLTGTFGLGASATQVFQVTQASATALEDSTNKLSDIGLGLVSGATASLSGQFSATVTCLACVGFGQSTTITGDISKVTTDVLALELKLAANSVADEFILIDLSQGADLIDQAGYTVTVTPVNDRPEFAAYTGATTAETLVYTKFPLTITDVDSSTAPVSVNVQGSEGAEIRVPTSFTVPADVSLDPTASTVSSFFSIMGPLSDVNSVLAQLEVRFPLGTTAGSVIVDADDLGNGDDPAATPTSLGASTQVDFTLTCATSQAAPTFSSAKYLNNGYQINVNFSLPIYVAPGTAGDCGRFFDDSTVTTVLTGTGGTQPSCFINPDGKSILITLGSAPAVTIGSPSITIKASAIKTCEPSTNFFATQQITVIAPDVVPVPTAGITAPAKISFCENLNVFSVVESLVPLSFTQWSATNSLFALEASSSLSEYSFAPNVLTPGTTYDFVLDVTNSLGGTAKATATTEVSNLPVPAISIKGFKTQKVTVTKDGALELFGAAKLSPCVSGSQLKLNYQWSVTPAISGFNSLQTKKPNLRVPFNLINPTTTYTFKLDGAMAFDATLSGSASVTVEPQLPALEARIVGGEFIKVSKSAALPIKIELSTPDVVASPSYTYTAACVDSSGRACFDRKTNAALSLTNTALNTVAADSLAAGSYTFTATITESGRTATASQKVQVVSGVVPAVTISAAGATVINPVDEVFFTAAVAATDDGISGPWTLEYQWSVVEGDLTLNAAETALATTDTIIVNAGGAAARFRQGSTYKFRVTVTQRYNDAAITSAPTGFTEVSVRCNSAPGQGVISAPTTTGEALTTAFSFAATGFDDADKPLSYSFYVKKAGVELQRTPFLPVPRLTVPYLPAGDAADGNKLTVGVDAQDIFGASTSAETTITVTPKVISTAQLDTLFSASASSANDVADADALLAAVSTVTAVLDDDTSNTNNPATPAGTVDNNSAETKLKESMLNALSGVATSSSPDVICNAAASIGSGGISPDMGDKLLEIANSIVLDLNGKPQAAQRREANGKLSLGTTLGAGALAAGNAADAASTSRRRLLAFPAQSRTQLEGAVTSIKDTLRVVENSILTVAGTRQANELKSDGTYQDIVSSATRFAHSAGAQATARLSETQTVTFSVPAAAFSGIAPTQALDARIIASKKNLFAWDASAPTLVSGAVVFEVANAGVVIPTNTYNVTSSGMRALKVSFPYSLTDCPLATCAPVCTYFDGETFNDAAANITTMSYTNGVVTCGSSAPSQPGKTSGFAAKAGPAPATSSSSSTGAAAPSSSTGGSAPQNTTAAIPADATRGVLVFNLDYATVIASEAAFRVNVTENLALATGESASRFDVKSIVPGSVIVTLDILGVAGGSSSLSVLQNLQAQLADPSSVLLTGSQTRFLTAIGRKCADGTSAEPCAEDPEDDDDGLSGAAIAAIVIAVFAAVAIGGAVIYKIFIEKNRKAIERAEDDAEAGNPLNTNDDDYENRVKA